MRTPLPPKLYPFLLLFIFLFHLTMDLATAQSWQVVTPKYGADETVVAGFIADAAQYGNGSTDATTYIQNCLNQLDNAVNDANHGGGVLFLPEGKYKITGTILIPKGITIRGDWQKPIKGQPIVGTILMAYSGKGSATATPFITMQPGAAVIDVAIWYPDQDPNNIVAYPPSIQFGQPNYFGNEFCNVRNVTLVNSYSGIYFYTGGGTCPTINNVYGTPLKQGVEIDRIVDIGRTEWIDFSPAYWAGSGLPGAPSLTNTTYTNWIYTNGTGIVMRRNDWSYTNYVTIDGYNKGFYATVSVDPNDPATPNGHNYGFTFTNCKYGVYFDGNNSVGIMFTEMTVNNCQYGVYAAPNTGGVLQLYRWNINATMCALYSDKTSATKITMQESTVTSGKVELQGGVFIATDNDFNNAQPQVQFEYNSRGNLTGNRFKNPVQISEKSVFVNQIDHAPVVTTKLPPYYQFVRQAKKPLRNVMYNVTSFGVTAGTRNAIPAADATTGIQNALNKAKTDGGGIVYLPPGHYRINGSLTIPTGVELKGSVDIGEFPMGPGSVLEVYGNGGNESGASPIQMQQGSGLRGIVFNYPDQVFCTVLPESIIKYPYTVQVQGSDAYIINVGFRAAYKGVDLFTYKCDRFYLDFLTGHVFNAGVKVDNGSADGVIANMQFNTIVYNAGDETKFGSWPNSDRSPCSTDATKNPYNYGAKYLDFLTIGNAPNITLYNDFNYGANHGLILQNGASGTALGLGLDGDRTGILVDGNANFNFTNTQDVSLNYDALGGEQSSYIKTTANYTSGTINMFSSDYWGQATSSGIVMNGAGTINLNSANFQSPGSNSFANVNNGTLNINNSVVNPVNPLVNGTKVSGVNISGSQVSPYSLNTSTLGSYKDNFSTASPSPSSALNRTGWIASASRSNSGRDPKYSIDGDATTSWSSGWQNDGVAVWFQMDMLTPQTFNEVILDYSNSPNDGPGSYTFSVSNDGQNWSPLTSGTAADQMTIITVPTTTARYIRIDKPASVTKVNFWAIQEFYVFNVTAPVDQIPYNGSPFAIPGTIEVEHYDLGGEGVAYHDATTTNDGDGNFRTTEGVDIGVCSAGGYDIGWTTAGEWVAYSVNVATSGSYDIQYAVASGGTGAFHLEMDNVDITGTLNVSTGGWQTWQTLKKSNVQLIQGVHILKFVTNGGMNIDKLIFTQSTLNAIPMSNPLFHQFTSPLYQNTGTGNMYTADPSAHVWNDGRLYVYASHDIEPAVGCDRMDRYHVFSTNDMVNWVDHGEILNASQVSWGRAEGGFMWAPDCAYNPANQTYYFYYPHPSGTDWGSTWKIGVATSKEPAANFTDQGYIAGLESMIDPCVFVDDDGQAYLYYGGGGKCMGGKLDPTDWTKLTGTMQPMQGLVDFHEATWVHKYNGKYYLSHSDNHGSDGNQMKYAVSDSPLGPWKDMGVYMYATGCDTDHGSIVQYNNQWYSFYHTSNFSGQYNLRSVCVDKLNYNADGSIQVVNNWGTPFNNVTRTVAVTNNTTDIALTVEAEDFNDGGSHYGYWDKDDANLGSNTSYRPNLGVDIETRANNVINVGNMQNGEWLRYTINVVQAGLYDLDFVVASGNSGGGKFHVSVNGTNLSGDVLVPFTSSDWNTWTTVSAKNIVLQAGQQYIDIRINGGFNFDKFKVRKSSPYAGTAFNGPHNVPGTVEAEDYDNGGPNVAYYDADPTNQSGAYRPNEGVDLENSSGSIHISWSNSGEWETYTLNVTTAGIYDVQIPVATGNGATGSLSLTFDDIYNLPMASINTGSWNTYQLLTIKGVQLSAGTHVMKLNIGGNINVDKFTFVSTASVPIISSQATATGTVGAAFTYSITASNNPTSFAATGLPAGLTLNTTSGVITGTPTTAGTYNVTVSATNAGGTGTKAVTFTINNATNTPYGGTAWTIPGTIQAENYDDGGEGIAYHDADVINSGGQQRTNQGVDVETTGDATGTYNVGWTAAGEWMKYSVNVTTAGTYTLQARVASPNTGKSFHVEIDGTTIATVAVPNTTGWQTYQTVNVTTGNITAGNHVMRIFMDTDGFNLNYVTYASITPVPVISSASTATGTVGVAFTYNITASNTPTSYGATGLPIGLNVNATTGAITGTPSTAGTFNATITATNAGGTASQALAITINPASPVISSAATATGTVGVAFTYSITASNSPTSYGATGLPTGLTVNTSTGVISGTPTTAATYNATITATNAGGTGSKAVTFTISNPSSTPYGGTPWAIPGTIQAENYDDGGEGLAYHDADVANQGGQQRTSQGVDIEGTGDATGTYNVGWTSQGEWMKYTVNVAATGTYTLQARVASPYSGKSFHVEIDGTTIATVAIPNTSGWQTYQTVTVTTSAITAGSHIMRIYIDTDGFNLNYVSFANGAAPAITSATTASAPLGGSFNYTITASNNPTSYNATGLPTGLTVNSITGVISGTVNNAGTYNVTISASNSSGTASATLEITVAAVTDPAGVITCYMAPGVVTVNGSLTESGWNLNKQITKTVYGTVNNTATFGAIWDNTNLYIGVKVLDGNLYADSPDLWEDDAVEIYIDANYNKLTTYDGLDNQIIKGYNKSGVFSKFSLTGIQHAYTAISGGYTMEFAIPWSQLGINAPVSGTNIGFDISYDDDDNGGTREGQAVWNGTVDDYQNTSNFGRLTLSSGVVTKLTDPDLATTQESKVMLYPNPVTNGEVSALVPNDWENEVIVTIWNDVGEVVYTTVTMIDSNQFKVDVSTLQSGIYLIKLDNGAQSVSQPFIMK